MKDQDEQAEEEAHGEVWQGPADLGRSASLDPPPSLEKCGH